MHRYLRLDTANRALNVLLDEQELERARARFSRSPPYYKSPSTDSDATEPGTPMGGWPGVPRVQPPESLEDKRLKIQRQRSQSRPNNLFELEKMHKADEILRADSFYNPNTRAGPMQVEKAERIIKQRWIDQGIWRDEWNGPKGGVCIQQKFQWKHEDPIQELMANIGSGARGSAAGSLFGGGPTSVPAKSEEEMQRLKREREASRPFHQFIYQVSIERQDILERAPSHGSVSPSPVSFRSVSCEEEHNEEEPSDEVRPEEREPNEARATPDMDVINTTAYKNVKAKWIEFGIWKSNWEVLPGMSWKHEYSLEDLLRLELPEALALGTMSPIIKPTDVLTQRPEDWWDKNKERLLQERRAKIEALRAKVPPVKSIFGDWKPPQKADGDPPSLAALLAGLSKEQSHGDGEGGQTAHAADHASALQSETPSPRRGPGRKRKAVDEPKGQQPAPKRNNSGSPCASDDNQAAQPNGHLYQSLTPSEMAPAPAPVRRSSRIRTAEKKDTAASDPIDGVLPPAGRKRRERTKGGKAASPAPAQPEAEAAAPTPGRRGLRNNKAQQQKTAVGEEKKDDDNAASARKNAKKPKRRGKAVAAAKTAKPKAPARASTAAAAKTRGVAKRGRGRPARQSGR